MWEERKLSNPVSIGNANNLTLITGGARSGKSTFAESLASRACTKVVYVATMEQMQSDLEAAERIRRHRERRPPHWATVERPLNAHEAIDSLGSESLACIFDCLSLYVSNIVLDGYQETASMGSLEEKVLASVGQLLEAMKRSASAQFFVVTNEVGWGVVPENGLARVYRDLLGVTNQLFARSAGEVWLCCSGLQLKLKPQP